MNEYKMTKEESRVARHLRNMLTHDEALKQRVEGAGILCEDLLDPEHPLYIADTIRADAAEDEALIADIRKVLDQLLREQDDGCWLTTTRIDHWERHTLSAMLRQLWRIRNCEGELRFLRGDYSRTSPPMFWRAEIMREQGCTVLRCFDEERRNFLYYVLSFPEREVGYGDFCRELREFLGFDEESVWLQGHTSFRLEGVQ